MKKQKYEGLSDEKVLENRKKFGENILTKKVKKSVWAEFIEKFSDPIIIILLTALVLSAGISVYEYFFAAKNFHIFFEPIGIFLAIFLATGVAFYFEQRANKQFEILNKVNDDVFFSAIRNGKITQILKKDIVVGDVILLNTGDEVPADGQLLEAVSLQINESSLTGELSIDKTTNPAEFDPHATYPSNQIFKGTSVISGHCVFEVQQVGDNTQYGKIFQGIQIEQNTETPLNQQLKSLADIITKISYGIAFLMIFGRMFLYFFNENFTSFDWISFGSYLLSTIMIAVTIIVVSVPEGLPMSITLSLAYSMRSMMKTHNLVRKMHACETMGAVTIICTDKTGTLTQNQMKVHEFLFNLTGENSIIDESIAVNSTAHLDFEIPENPKVLGNPTEGALLLWLHNAGKNYSQIRESKEIIWQIPFSTENKFMATLLKNAQNQWVLLVKGAPEIVMSFCQWTETDLYSAHDFQQKLSEYQHKAMRTIGFAYQIFEQLPENFSPKNTKFHNLTFLGISAITDPVRIDVPDAIKECSRAGIGVKIITGDTPATAQEIARQIGLWNENHSIEKNHISGTEINQLSDNELIKKLSDILVVSRAKPQDKERLVNLLQQQGEIVAVTGDGTNDALALKTAQVGLSMGDGTSVAKQASDITILNNSFGSISRAVMWGRSLYLNIQRFIIFQMTINVVACLIVLAGAFLGTQSPLNVTQMLWVNLIMDTFAALALASLPPQNSVMNNKPRSQKANIVTRTMAKRIFGIGGIFVLFLFGLAQYFKYYDLQSLSEFSWNDYATSFLNFSSIENGFSPYELSLFFSIFVMLQFWNMFNAKAFASSKSAFAELSKSKGFLLISVVILGGQILITSFASEMFQVVPLNFKDWILLISSTSIVLWIGEISRLLKNFSMKK